MDWRQGGFPWGMVSGGEEGGREIRNGKGSAVDQEVKGDDGSTR
jgi:hypothetical protein